MAGANTLPEWAAALPGGDYLRALRLLRAASAADEAPESPSAAWLVYLLQAVSRFAEATAIRARRDEQLQRRGSEALPAALRKALEAAAQSERLPDPPEISPTDVAPLLRQAVQEHRLVILGEEHPHPEHRAFGTRLILLLRTAGITHLALETNAQAPLEEARRSGCVTPATDGFSFEPQRAALLRAALAANLSLVAFDMDMDDAAWLQAHPEEMFAYRERRMAEHIMGRILERDPAARVLVWVGHGHGQKRTPLKMMAQYLWELAGEEPFSAYQLTGEGRRPGVDVLIRHPEPSYERDRPDWLRRGDRRSVAGVVEPHGSYLVQLHQATEGPAGTPIDQVLTGADGAFELLVSAGDYLLRLWTPDERVVETRPLAVEANILDLHLRG